jgi:hypothetical protein
MVLATALASVMVLTGGAAYAADGASGARAVAAVGSAPTIAQAVACPANVAGTVRAIKTVTSPRGVGGTTTADLADFAKTFNAIRVANCLRPVPLANFRYDACMEKRLFWIAESPSTNPADAWGHIGTVRIDGVPSVGCDGNLAGGSGNSGSTVAQKWWDSTSHRASLYRPGSDVGGVCIAFAMTHGGVPNEPYSFTRAAAHWANC